MTHPVTVPLLAVLAGAMPAADRPNVIIFLVDDMGLMDTSVPFITDAQGRPQRQALNDFHRTPAMQRLAGQGVRFTQFYANSVSSPTRASIMTGQSAARHGTTNWINAGQNNKGKFGPPDWNWGGLTPADVTLPRLMAAAGWRTIHVGKAHFGANDHPGVDPTAIGFNVNIAGGGMGQPGSYLGTDNYGNGKEGKRAGNNAVPGLAKYHGTGTFLTEALTLEANAQIDAAVKDGKPFFLYLAHYAVHTPFTADPRFIQDFEAADRPKQAKVFASMIAGMDKSLGDVLDHLQKRGIAQDTLVIFLGDNGSDAPLGKEHDIACAAPLRGKKGTHYEGGMRVPCIAAWARPEAGNPLQQRLPIAAGAVQTQVGTIHDLLPTVLEVAGVANPPSHPIDGASLKPLCTGQRDAAREESFLMHYPHDHRSRYFTSFRLGTWKLVHHYRPEMNPAKVRYELFDLAADPTESDNRAEREPARLKTMMRSMVQRLDAQGAKYPVDDDGTTPVKPVVP